MDSKVALLAVLLSISAIALVVLVVYATNMGEIKRNGGGSAGAQATESLQDVEVSESALKVARDGFVAYGEQIGKDVKAFMRDERFFDPMKDVQGINEGDDEKLTLTAVPLGGTIHVSVTNSRGGLEEGVAFQVTVERRGGRQLTYTDTDQDGQIDVVDQESGSYQIYLLPAQGYSVPATPVAVEVNAPVEDIAPDAKGDAATDATDGGTVEPVRGTEPGTWASGTAPAPSGDSATGISGMYVPVTGATLSQGATGAAGASVPVDRNAVNASGNGSGQ